MIEDEFAVWYEYLKKRWLYFLGFVFIYFFPLVMICDKLSEVRVSDKRVVISGWWLAIGMGYLAFLSRFINKKIDDMKPSAFKSFLSGIFSLIPLTVIAALITFVQVLVNSMPDLNIAKCCWMVIASVAIGLFMQVIDAGINKKFLYDIEIQKEAQRAIDVEYRKKELIEEREKLNNEE